MMLPESAYRKVEEGAWYKGLTKDQKRDPFILHRYHMLASFAAASERHRS